MRVLLLLSFFCISFISFSQNVEILPTGITPVLSGAYPRLQYSAILALPNPTEGDMAYDLTYHCLRIYNGEKWVNQQSQGDSTPSISLLNSITGSNNDSVYGMILDDSSNVYLTGATQANTYFGSTLITTTTSSSAYVAKFDKNGNLKWVQTTSGTALRIGYDIAFDNVGNIYITGIFTGTATFGTSSLTSAGGNDIFVAKYNKNGVFQWVQRAGGTGDDQGKAIDVDSNSNVYVTGHFNGVATFDNLSVTSSGSSDFYIAKYNSNGNIEWVQKGGGTSVDSGNDIKVDDQNNIVVTGSFYTSGTFGTISLTSSGGSDVFLAKYQADGTVSWIKKAGGTSTDYGLCIDLDSNGNIYLAGTFTNVINFESITITGNSVASSDIFVGKYLSNGTLAWVKGMGGNGPEDVYTLGLDSGGNIYIAGTNSSSIFFINSQRYLSGKQSGDVEYFILKMSNDGNTTDWFIQNINSNSSSIFSGNIINLDCNSNGEIFISQSYSGLYFNREKRYQSYGTTDAFFGKIIP